MKMKYFIPIVAAALLGVLCTVAVLANPTTPIEARWKKVDDYAERQLPESALKEVDAILKQAKKEKNGVQIIKAMLYRCRLITEKDPDELVKQMREFESAAEAFDNLSDKAVMYMLTAEIYAAYYQEDRYMIDQRTAVDAAAPDDVKTWTRNHFVDKITELSGRAVAHPDALKKTDVLAYAPILTPGKDSRTIMPTLFDFLAYKRIDLLRYLTGNFYTDTPLTETSAIERQMVQTVDSLIAFNRLKNNMAALIYAELRRLEMAHPSKNDDFAAALDTLQKRYERHQAVVEIMAEKANHYLRKEAETPEKGDEKYRKAAYDIAQRGIKQYPNYQRIGLLKNIENNLLQKNLIAENSITASPNGVLKIALKTQNIGRVKLTVYKINASATEYFRYKVNEARNYTKALHPKRTEVHTVMITPPFSDNFDQVDTTVLIPTAGYGIYEYTVEEPDNRKGEYKALGGFTVTDMAFFHRSGSVSELYVVNRLTGQPLSDANATVYEQKWDANGYKLHFVKKVTASSDSRYLMPADDRNNNYRVFFERGADRFFHSAASSYGYAKHKPTILETLRVSLFTDRAIYRPGQTLHFKGIAYRADKRLQQTVSGEHIEVELLNTNGERIASKQFTSNDFGSFSGSFVLPDKGLNGAYALKTKQTTATLWVEEYKRPTFEVAMERPKEEVRFGETVTIKGVVKAYAGYSVANASVKYRVVRRPHSLWRWRTEPEKTISTGTTSSDTDGVFRIAFTPIKDSKKLIYNPWRRHADDSYYTYHIYADATDPKGETQQGEQSVSVGDKALLLWATVPDKVDKSSGLSIGITAQTLNGETVHTSVDYRIVRLENPEVFYEKTDEKTKWKERETVRTGTLNSKDTLLLDLKKTESGLYKIIVTAKDNRGNTVETENRFLLYSPSDKRPPVNTYVWLVESDTRLRVGEKAVVCIGTSTRNTSLLYELMQGTEMLESRWITLNDEVKTFEIPFRESYGAGVVAQFTFVKDEQLFTRQVPITRRVEEKRLTPHVSVFRDKLRPGERAEWTIHIPEAVENEKTVGDKKTAELLIGMYDASLDAIRPHRWWFDPTYRERLPYTPIWDAGGLGDTESDGATIPVGKYTSVEGFAFDDFNRFGFNVGFASFDERPMVFGNNVRVRGRKQAFRARVSEEVLEEAMAVVESKLAIPQKVETTDLNQVNDAASIADTPEQDRPKLRTNFNETAFFYPQLHTDAQGNVKVAFTAPESLTRWQVKMLAHTRDLYVGQNSMEVVTQKELMVQMNLPRFVRQSDKLLFAANITNLSEHDVRPTATLEIIDPASGKTLRTLTSKVKGDVLPPNQTMPVYWEPEPLRNLELAVVKITAQTDRFSDGEQRYLPVLPDKVMVTESRALTVRAGETRTFTFDRFIDNLHHVQTARFTVEYAGNPTWYAVQALPSVAQTGGDNAIDYLTGFYANTLGGYIANANPKLSDLFDRWKKGGGTRDALLSNLEKNQELKSMLLEETPWVMDAKDETEQKRQIALLFDLNQTRYQAQTYMDKLLRLQTPNGGFAWFEKMPESRYITQEVLLHLARLNKMVKGKIVDEHAAQIRSALNYLDLQIANDYFELKKHNKNYRTLQIISNLQLFYLHTRSEYHEVPIHPAAREAVKYYTERAEKAGKHLTLYGKAMMATVAHRNGKTALANEMLSSLRENAMKTDEMGMYWNANKPGLWWHERPIATQTAVIEAFSEIRGAVPEVDEMKIWLLKQKQTQHWDTPISTLNAIYALLNYGSDWTADEGKVVVTLGSTTLKPQDVEPGTAYLKEAIPTESLTPDVGKITVQNKNAAGITWGAAYWQYYQEVNRVEAHGKELKIEKQLFVERVTTQGKSMVPVANVALKRGDKVITRLVVTTDRDMEFVSLKDLRAACFEPVIQTSGTYWKEGVVYYQTTKDASTLFFFNYLPKGTYVFEYALWVNNSGVFSSGIASVQCYYAPEFTAHSHGEKVTVKAN